MPGCAAWRSMCSIQVVNFQHTRGLMSRPTASFAAGNCILTTASLLQDLGHGKTDIHRVAALSTTQNNTLHVVTASKRIHLVQDPVQNNVIPKL